MREYFNDSPIETAMDDRYGVHPFAKSVAKSIEGIAHPVGTAIALNGAWGSGKSSVVNLVRNALTPADKGGPVVTDFKCWWYKGEEALALAFLQNLNTVLEDNLGKEVKGLIPELTRGLLRAGPVLGTAISLVSGHPWIASLITPSAKYAESFFPEGKTVEKTFRKLADLLAAEKHRFLVIIDDIDRLTPDEALAIFRLVKSVGHLPNVIYLLVYDRELADKAVAERYPSEGPHFLEKIVQAAFEVPNPMQVDLNQALLESIQKICGNPPERQMVRTMNLFYDIVVPYMSTPRHIVRFENAISVTWPAIANEVNLADFMALEALRLYEPSLLQAIKAGRKKLCGTRQQGDPDGNNDARFDPFRRGVPAARRDVIAHALQRLFPRLERSLYGDGFTRQWDQERRVCIERHFDTYFRLSLGEGNLSHPQIEGIVARADDRAYVQELFRHAATVERPNGQSMVPVYLSDLTTHADRIPVAKVQPLLAALFEIQDEIDLERDKEKGFYGMGNTTLRFHWLIRALTRDRMSLAERSAVYVAALANASPGWLADFTRSAYEDYHPTNDRHVAPEDFLVEEDVMDELVRRALDGMRRAAADGSLLRRHDLRYDLHLWKEFAGRNPAEPRAWTDGLLDDDLNIAILARAFTSQSWSFGMGFDGLGDRVSRPATQAAIDPATDIVDFPKFRRRMEEIAAAGHGPEAGLTAIRELLTALDRPQRRRGENQDDDDDGDDL